MDKNQEELQAVVMVRNIRGLADALEENYEENLPFVIAVMETYLEEMWEEVRYFLKG